ncbi:AAA domain-containing protein, putative AbiEii toxin, Type IV TA system [Chryseobacterium ureilyticum]|uniref:AAA domain-containing protein, putative AbiEii toxin, Type IV TA system n=1 Tax=Chryseobacterium ureilyticum TaxID=373668 RepID=A0A1N7P0G6_9FLAO|nr:AAA family ATPase [Chryseobacterium ureilyticum]SIT04073.1 AAA domain-containing protein, putative AbiEii toxin, Type IV TA system [Chryseobacterium ureilyticum]
MFQFNNENLELFKKSKSDEDVNIIVGVNGSGKSTYLNEIAKYHLKEGKTVIGVANTIYDKFTIKGKAKLLKSSRGKNIVKNSFKEIINILEKQDNSKAFFNLSSLFTYINFRPKIEFKIQNLNPNFEKIITNSLDIDNRVKSDIIISLQRAADISWGDIRVFLDFNKHYLQNIQQIEFIFQILKFENKLKQHKILRSVEIKLYKESSSFPLNNSSSGELTLIASLMYISVNIDENSVILIDEPENSLHPNWQMNYVKKLNELFYFYQAKIIIATHSPLIINGAELEMENVNIFKGISFKRFVKQSKELKNVEEIYTNYFDVTTPENRYLSQFIIDKFNLLSKEKMLYNDFKNMINELIIKSYDNRQKQALTGILELANNYS